MNTTTESDCLLAKIPFAATHSFSRTFLDYIQNKGELENFHNGLPSPERIHDHAEQSNFSAKKRQVLYDVLSEAYQKVKTSPVVKNNLESLKKENTFTITTGHQLNIFTGPLYFIYKIITTIKACEVMNEKYPKKHFVPVYWMASEDHDFDEIDHFRFNGKTFRWETKQKGAVGHFHLDGLDSILKEIMGMPDFFKEAYTQQKNLADACLHYVNALFGAKGLIVLNADHPRLKEQFKGVMHSDIFDNRSESLVNESLTALQAMGYETPVTPRGINFFYLKEGLRERIVKEGDQYAVLGTKITWSKTELEKEIEIFPQRFSPNVVLRPLYQEQILPNLAYIGGPSELVYWLQLKSVFDLHNTPFPVLMPRNFAAILNPDTLRKVEQIGLDWEELFMPTHEVVKAKVIAQSPFNLDLEQPLKALAKLFEEAQQEAKAIDTTLEQLVKAEQRKAEKSFEKIERKMLKAERKNQEILVNRIYAIHEHLFPDGTPQERKDNFLNFYLHNDQFVTQCFSALDPFDFRFHLLKCHE